jgi:acetyl esterase
MLPLDPGMLAFYKELSARTPPGSEAWPLPEQRQAWDELCRLFRAPRPPGIAVQDLDANGVHVRVFNAGPRPGVIYFHGGGWVLGSCETHDDMCAELAALADVAVVLVDYRLAPEHPHPAQLEDSLKVWDWMTGQGFTSLLAAGDSAGGQMSVALALSVDPKPAGLVLIYPVLGADTETASYIRNANAPCLTRSEMVFYLESFLGPRGNPNWTDPKAVPNLLTDLRGLPPAFITVAAHDPLCDDGIIFHEKLKSSGVPSQLRIEPALAHSYMRARHQSAPAMAGFRAIAEALKELSLRRPVSPAGKAR